MSNLLSITWFTLTIISTYGLTAILIFAHYPRMAAWAFLAAVLASVGLVGYRLVEMWEDSNWEGND